METVKLTQQEIETINNLKQQFNGLVNTLGIIEYQILDFKERKLLVEQELLTIRNSEQELVNQLTEKYGEGTISLEAGEFIKN